MVNRRITLRIISLFYFVEWEHSDFFIFLGLFCFRVDARVEAHI